MKVARYMLALCAWLTVVAASADEESGEVEALRRVGAPWAMSTSQRFLVTGLPVADCVEIGAWAEEVAGRIEQFLGIRLDFGTAQLFHIAVRTGPKSDEGDHVEKTQTWTEGRLKQKFILNDPDRIDPEDAMEGLAWLLLNSYVINMQSDEERRIRMAEVPAWLSIGVAQNLYRGMRARNSQVILRHWENTPSMQEMLALAEMPEGRWMEKAAAGLAVAWMHSLPSAAVQFDRLFRRLARNKDISHEWMRKSFFRSVSDRELEKQWDLWIAHEMDVKRTWDQFPIGKFSEFKSLLVIRPVDYGVEDNNLPSILNLGDLIDYRYTETVPPIASLLGLRVKSLGLGEPDIFRKVVDGYGRFLDAIGRTPSHRAGEAFDILALTDKDLRQLLSDAEAALVQMELEVFNTGAATPQDPVDQSRSDQVYGAQTYSRDLERRMPAD